MSERGDAVPPPPTHSELRPSDRALPRNVKLLGLASLLNDIASELAFPLLPLFITGVLGGSRLQLGAIEGVAETTASLTKLFGGSLADRLGKRRGLILVGYGLAAVARPLIGLATAPWHVFAFRSLDRLGKGLRTAPRDALIADSTRPEMRGRAFGFHRAMDHAGAAIGPLLALAFLAWRPNDLRQLFELTLIPGLLVVLLLWFGLKDRPRETAVAEPFRLTWRPFDRSFRRYLLVLALFTLGNSSDMFVLARAEELGASGPALWCAFHVIKGLGNLVAGSAVDRVGPRPLIVLGWLVYAAIYGAFAWADQGWQIWALFLGYGLFYALTEPAEKALVARLAHGSHRGLGFGWYNFVTGLTVLPANLIFGALYEWYGPGAAFGFGAATAVVAALLFALLLRAPDR